MNELKPCPFCEVDKDEIHYETCPFSYMRVCDLDAIPDEAWNSRTLSLDEVLEVVRREKFADDGCLSDHDKLANQRINRIEQELIKRFGGGE